MMVNLRFVADHNITAFLGDISAEHEMFKPIVHGLILSPVNYAIMESPTICSSFIHEFWNSISEDKDLKGNVCLIGKVQGLSVIISEEIIRECLQFGDKPSDPTELSDELVESTLMRMGYEGVYPPTEKKLLHPYWRYLAHVVIHCLSGRKGGYDVLNQTLSSCMVAIALGVDFNFSRMIFKDMYENIKRKRKERFLAFPRFIQIIINKRHQNLVPTMGMLVQKKMPYEIFSYMVMNKKGKKNFVGVRPLEMFGRLFAGLEDKLTELATTIAFVAEEHDQTKAAETEHATSSESSASMFFKKRKQFPTNQYERDVMKKRKASKAPKPFSTDGKDEYHVRSPDSVPKKRLKMASRRLDDRRLRKQKATHTTQPQPTCQGTQRPQKPLSPPKTFQTPQKSPSSPKSSQTPQKLPSPLKPIQTPQKHVSPPQSPASIHFSHPLSPPKTQTGKVKSPVGTSSTYVSTDLDLLQARVFTLEQDSAKKDEAIKCLRLSTTITDEHIKNIRKNITYLMKVKSPMETSSTYMPTDLDLLQERVFALEQDSAKKDEAIKCLRLSTTITDDHIKNLRKNITYLMKENYDLKNKVKDLKDEVKDMKNEVSDLKNAKLAEQEKEKEEEKKDDDEKKNDDDDCDI